MGGHLSRACDHRAGSAGGRRGGTLRAAPGLSGRLVCHTCLPGIAVLRCPWLTRAVAYGLSSRPCGSGRPVTCLREGRS
jgi:hypothetical protein